MNLHCLLRILQTLYRGSRYFTETLYEDRVNWHVQSVTYSFAYHLRNFKCPFRYRIFGGIRYTRIRAFLDRFV